MPKIKKAEVKAKPKVEEKVVVKQAENKNIIYNDFNALKLRLAIQYPDYKEAANNRFQLACPRCKTYLNVELKNPKCVICGINL